jgi:hypothetical protein
MQEEDFYTNRSFSLPRTSKLSEEIIQQLDHLLDFAPPEEYRNTLIEIYHSYIRHEHHALPIAFDHMANHMSLLTAFLLMASKEMANLSGHKVSE